MQVFTPDILKPFFIRPVAIFGAGVSGLAVQKLLRRVGVDNRVYDAGQHGGRLFLDRECEQHSLVVFSPGFSPEHPWLMRARAAGLLCLAELDFSALFWREQLRQAGSESELVAITGTNGKTTLTEFLTFALRSVGEKAHAVGNIGTPLAQLVLDHTRKRGREIDRKQIAVCEVSSFQAEALQYFQADAVLWTNFAEDHLDRHGSLPRYFAAKARLLASAPADSVFVGACVARAAREFKHTLPPYAAMRCEDPFFDENLAGTIFEGPPQQENFRRAMAWWRHTDRCPHCLTRAAKRFTLGAHRLAKVAERGGVTYWNDSKATNFNAVEGALARFAAAKTPVHLILGGRSKGGDVRAFIERIAPRVAHIYLIGETGPSLADYCASAQLVHTRCASLEDAVAAASAAAKPGEAILLSPGFASYDFFNDYQERGQCFENAVLALDKTAA